MAYLVAQGPAAHHRWRRSIPAGKTVTIGRAEDCWQVDWDSQVSRKHCDLTANGDSLVISMRSEASNPVFVNGEAIESTAVVSLTERFVIGQTSFHFVGDEILATINQDPPFIEQTFLVHDLHKLAFSDPSQRIELLSRLPDLMAGVTTDDDLFVKLTQWLLEGIRRASGIAIVSFDISAEMEEAVTVFHWDQRSERDGVFAPSRQLIQKAVTEDVTVVHFWDHGTESDYTQLQNTDWAFCIPVGGHHCPGWAIYVAGRGEIAVGGIQDTAFQSAIRDDLKFAEVAASTVGNIRGIKKLQATQTQLQQFFPEVVMDAIEASELDELLQPSETRVTVIFCDLRGYSRKSEQLMNDLTGLLNRTSAALSIMTRHILANDGVVGDFHGDAVMGFWGWPVADEKMCQKAVDTAVAIMESFSHEQSVDDFHVGIGLATGMAVAGKIGSDDQVKVSALGPVVNIASRLENLTRAVGGHVLLDQETASAISNPNRRLGHVQPYGMSAAVSVFELISNDQLAENLEGFRQFERALEAFESGKFDESLTLLSPIADQTMVGLLKSAVERECSDGIIRLESK